MPGNRNALPVYADAGPEGQEFDLLEWVQLFWEYRWWIAGLSLAGLLLAALYSFLATPIYSATATVYVQSYSRTPLNTYNPTGATSWMEEEKFYNSQAEIIRSQAVMQEAADRLKLASHPAFRESQKPEEAWKALAAWTKVETVRDSALFKITVSAPYKEDVARWADTIAEVYRDKTLQDALDVIRRANAAMLAEAQKMQEEYVRQQGLVASTLQASGSYFPQNQKEILDKRIEALELKLNDVAVRESETSAVVGQIRNALARGDETASLPTTSTDLGLQESTRQYNEMARELSRLLVKYTPQHPDVKALKQRLQKQGQAILDSYQAQLAALRSERANLTAELEAVKRQGLQFVEGASRGEALTTSGAAIKKYMDILYDKMKELNVSSALLSSNVRIVNHAIPPEAPVKPRKALNMILGLLLGAMASTGWVLAWRFLDTRVKDVEALESRLGLNLLTLVPVLSQETDRAVVESFQTLRTALLYATENSQKNLILVTSAGPKEGKTTVAVNLARTLANTGDKTLLVDCDLRRPQIHRVLGLSAKTGLTSFLAQKEAPLSSFLVQGPHPNLWVLAAGPIPPNPPEIFSMKRFQDLLEGLRKEFTWVIVDAPPALSLADAQILGGMVDLVLLVARYKQTQRPLLERTLLTLRRHDIPVAGLVLNDVDPKSGSYYESYYYSHYYYETGKEPRKIPWIVAKAGRWSEVLGRKGHRG